jgi:hypothetical protein
MTVDEPIEKLELLENGLDFLISGLNALIEKTEKESGRSLFSNVSLITSDSDILSSEDIPPHPEFEFKISDIELKYAIINLSAGIELILKERLKQEHWSLIFDNVDKANYASLQSGNFKSVYLETSISRLKQIVGVVFEENAIKHIEELKKERNRIEHFHFSPNRELLKKKISNAVMAILGFIVGNLNPYGFIGHTAVLYKKLISAIIESQLDETYRADLLEGKITQMYNGKPVVKCNICHHKFLILAEKNYCLFCGNEPSNQEIFDDTFPDSTARDISKCMYCSSELIYHQNHQLICLDCRKNLLAT